MGAGEGEEGLAVLGWNDVVVQQAKSNQRPNQQRPPAKHGERDNQRGQGQSSKKEDFERHPE